MSLRYSSTKRVVIWGNSVSINRRFIALVFLHFHESRSEMFGGIIILT